MEAAVRERDLKGAILYGLSTEKEAINQGMSMASRSWKKAGTQILLWSP